MSQWCYIVLCMGIATKTLGHDIILSQQWKSMSQMAKFMGTTWGPPGTCRPQMGTMNLAIRAYIYSVWMCGFRYVYCPFYCLPRVLANFHWVNYGPDADEPITFPMMVNMKNDISLVNLIIILCKLLIRVSRYVVCDFLESVSCSVTVVRKTNWRAPHIHNHIL